MLLKRQLKKIIINLCEIYVNSYTPFIIFIAIYIPDDTISTGPRI